MNSKEIIKNLVSQSNKVSTIAELERKLDISNGTISKWDKAKPTTDPLTKIAKFFDVSTDYLLGLTDKPRPEKTISSTDLDEILDGMMSFDGKPMTENDREAIRAYLEGRFSAK